MKLARLDDSIMDFLLHLQMRKIIYISNNTEAAHYGKQIFDVLKEKIVDPRESIKPQARHKDGICQILEESQICSPQDQKECKDTTKCDKGF